jgi:hypothetical protein
MAFVLIAATVASGRVQTDADSYTRYELLEPGSQSFRIYYDVTATSPGAHDYYNTIRKGAEPTVHGVYDLMTGKALEWTIVGGDDAKQGGVVDADAEGKYLKVHLARPVPEGGEARIRIDKTYKDPKSYYREGDKIVFSRTLGIKRNAVVLPESYELIRCNYPSQITTEPDGRVKVSFMNRGPAGVPYLVEARPLPERNRPTGASEKASAPDEPSEMSGGETRPTGARVDYTFSERAFQDREIVYFLNQPETHSFSLYHDYTESRAGVDRYLNVVRAGSKASNPSAMILDTGEKLEVETLRGNAINEKGIDIGMEVTPDTEVVVIRFDPVEKGHSVRLRIEETYTDPNRYLISAGALVWDRSFGRPRNTVILPEGWYVTENSIPATLRETDDGRIGLEYVNDRPGSIDVFIKARRR